MTRPTTRTPLLPALGLALGLLPAASAQTVGYSEFPDTNFYGMSSDGAWIVGNDGLTAIRYWSANETTSLLTGAPQAWSVSDSGLTVAGDMELAPTTRQAARHTPFTGWTPLEGIPGALPASEPESRTAGMSRNGTVITGYQVVGTPGGADTTAAFRWTSASGTQALNVPPTADASLSTCISGDGLVVGGYIDDVFTGSSARSIVLWDADGDWEELLPKDGGIQAFVRGLNHDGSKAVGRDWKGNAFLWESGSVTVLPEPPGFLASASMLATVVSDDGTVVAGEVQGYPLDDNYPGGWIWTAATGTQWLVDVFEQIGATATPAERPAIYVGHMTPDGTRILGRSLVTNGDAYSWILDLPPGGIGNWVDRGQQLTAGGVELTLDGDGLLTPESPTTLTIDGVVPFTTAWLVIGLSELSAPFKGGVLVPNADLVFPFGLVFPSAVPIPFEWPADVPSGFPLFFQVWGQSSPTLGAFVASNALEARSP